MYPKDLEIKIGFDAIRLLLAEQCLSPMGKSMVERMAFSSDIKKVQAWINQTNEFKTILDGAHAFPSDNYIDLTSILDKLGIEGLALSESELYKINQVCELMESISLFFKTKELEYPALFEIYNDIVIHTTIGKIITAIISAEGTIRANASPKLLMLSEDIAKYERDIYKKLLAIYKKAKDEGWAGETDISIRDGRPVIPIIAEHKKKIKGLVHDESNSGNILYIEPTEIVEANNNLRHLQFEKQREIERILHEVTLKLMPWKPALEAYLKKITLTDFIRAKALLALSIKAIKPLLQTNIAINQSSEIVDLFHPLLFLKLNKIAQKPVPLNFSLHSEKRIMVISGPNAGGKSVALKTIALNQYMLQCGLLVCSSQNSIFTLYKNMMVDIGDGQSIDQNLSSYSSHLTAMKHFVNFADKHTLFFIDELGSGTDPQFGGAIGEAILERLNAKKAFGVVTSHFSNIKNYAGQTEGFINGSMLYDLEKYQPLYALVSGKPGSSFAIELAKKTGLNNEIIQRAQSKVGKNQQKMEEILSEYEKQVLQSRAIEKRNLEKEILLNKLIADYTELKTRIAHQKIDIIHQAKVQANDILSETNKLIENSIREIKNSQADTVITKAIRKKLGDAKNILLMDKELPLAKNDSGLELEIGQLVKIKDQDAIGKVLQIGKTKILVEIGLIKSRLDFDKIERIAQSKTPKINTKIKGYNYHQISQNFSPRLDLRGMKTEEALHTTISAIDQALVLSTDKLWILHGKGDGILRKMIRQELKKINHVKKISSEHADFGGDGITIVELG